MAKAKPRIKVPATAKKGELITVKALIHHVMESGHRKHPDTGEPVPRKIINRFAASFNGAEVFAVDMHPAIATNPFFKFKVRATTSGTFTFKWIDDDGSVYEAERSMTVEG